MPLSRSRMASLQFDFFVFASKPACIPFLARPFLVDALIRLFHFSTVVCAFQVFIFCGPTNPPRSAEQEQSRAFCRTYFCCWHLWNLGLWHRVGHLWNLFLFGPLLCGLPTRSADQPFAWSSFLFLSQDFLPFWYLPECTTSASRRQKNLETSYKPICNLHTSFWGARN